MIRERSIAGQIAARERGREPGRVRSLEPDAEAEVVAAYRDGGVTYRELANKHGVSVSAVKRAVYRVTKGADYLKRGKV